MASRKENDDKKSGRGGLRQWASKLFIAILIPLAFLGMMELGLRIFGYGYKTAPMIPFELKGRRAICDNFRFPWRFFPPGISRDFNPFLFEDGKQANVFRIFILGSSAAQGVPDSAFAFGRILEVMLRETFPAVKFEVINTALTAVNSHAVLPIAKECLSHQADLIIVYMGNNEVVGPFGPGTVFAPFSSLALIRFSMALKTLRLGQLLGGLAQSLVAKKSDVRAWRGMEMFLEKQVPADDPRLKSVYRHFARNLEAIGRAAGRKATPVIFCTVAVNLKDCPPFASGHRADLSDGRRQEWENSCRLGIERENAGDDRGAAEAYRAASGIDDSFAELAFRMGGCSRRLGEYENAERSYMKARDLDTLRFRADGQINRLIRETAAGRESKKNYLADLEKMLAAQSDHGIPGDDLFLDHVHLNFRGNYLIARILFERIESLLPDDMKRTGNRAAGPPTQEKCAEELAYTDWDEYNIAEEMLNAYIKKPPFTSQMNHPEQVLRLERELTGLRDRLAVEAVQECATRYEAALARSPQDWWLHWKFAHLLYQGLKKDREALDHLRRVSELVPHSARGYSGMAFILHRLGDAEGAIDYCLKALAIDPTKAEIENILAAAFELKGWTDKAETRYKKAAEIQPHYSAPYMNLASLYARSHRLQDAVDICRRGLKLVPDAAELYVTLAECLNRMGRRDEAIAELKEAQRFDPQNTSVNRKLDEILWEKIKKQSP